jgi:hypothetical protein
MSFKDLLLAFNRNKSNNCNIHVSIDEANTMEFMDLLYLSHFVHCRKKFNLIFEELIRMDDNRCYLVYIEKYKNFDMVMIAIKLSMIYLYSNEESIISKIRINDRIYRYSEGFLNDLYNFVIETDSLNKPLGKLVCALRSPYDELISKYTSDDIPTKSARNV